MSRHTPHDALTKAIFVILGLAVLAFASQFTHDVKGAEQQPDAAGDPLHGMILAYADDGTLTVCPLHEASFDATKGIVASVEWCRLDVIFENGFEP